MHIMLANMRAKGLGEPLFGYNPNAMDEERSDGKILAGTSASTKRLTQAAQRADVRRQSERNRRRKIAEQERAAGLDYVLWARVERMKP